MRLVHSSSGMRNFLKELSVDPLRQTPELTVSFLAWLLQLQYEKRFEKDDREKDRRKAREAMSDKIQMKIEFRQQVSCGLETT